MITSVLSGCVWVILIIIVGGVLPSKKVLNSQRPRPAKPLGPRALRIPPSIPDLQNYSGVSNSFSSSPSPRNSPSTLFFLLLFCWSNHHYVWTHQKQEGRLSSRPVSTTMRFSSLPPPRGLTDRFVSSTVRLKTHPQTTPLSLLMPNSLVSLASKKVTKKNKTKILFPFEVLLYVLFPHPRFSPISPHFFFYSSLTKSL